MKNKANTASFEEIHGQVRGILTLARQKAYAAVNFAMVEAYWLVGQRIVTAQGGGKRAAYGSGLLKFLAERLTAEFGAGFDEPNLRKIRQFHLTFPIRDALRLELGWTHYRLIMRVPDESARMFYMEECAKSHWSVRQLERQIHTHFYERLLSSQNKKAVSAEINKTAPAPDPRDFIRSPYVLEFLNVNHSPELKKEIRSAITEGGAVLEKEFSKTQNP